jgi:hypothetical protein
LEPRCHHRTRSVRETLGTPFVFRAKSM